MRVSTSPVTVSVLPQRLVIVALVTELLWWLLPVFLSSEAVELSELPLVFDGDARAHVVQPWVQVLG
jgi:hypothetical protein